MTTPPTPGGPPPLPSPPHRYAEAVVPDTPPQAETAPVAADAPCRKCGYNLRGLMPTGRCPECGTPVGLSLHGDLLRYSDPTWLEALRRGVNLIIAAVVVVVVLVILAMTGAELFAGLLGIAAYIIYIVGTWQLTAPDPSGIGEDRYGRARQIIRVALIVGVFNQFVEFFARSVSDPNLRMLLLFVGFAAGVVGIVGFFAQLQYLEKLAVRIPDAKLERRANFLKYAVGVCYGLMLVVGLVVAIAGTGAGRSGPWAAFGCAAAVLGLALLVFGIMFLLMLEKFGKRFKEQAQLAHQTWGSAGPAPV